MRATKRQLGQLLSWAERFPERTWAIESVGGLGYLLAHQLLERGEVVLDVPATLASRVRVLGSGRSNKNDVNDALSVAIAALRSPSLAEVKPEDHVVAMRLLAKRHRDLGRERNRAANRLHALLVELVPAGITAEISVSSASEVLEGLSTASASQATRKEIALEHVEDLRRLDTQMAASKKRIADAVVVSKTC